MPDLNHVTLVDAANRGKIDRAMCSVIPRIGERINVRHAGEAHGRKFDVLEVEHDWIYPPDKGLNKICMVILYVKEAP